MALDNLIANGSVEDDLDGWVPFVEPRINLITNPKAAHSANADGWSIQGSGSETMYATTETDSPLPTVFHAYNGSPNTRYHYTAGVAVVPGDVVRFAGWARRHPGTGSIGWRIARPGFVTIESVDTGTVVSNQWYWREVVYTAVATETLNVYLHTADNDVIQFTGMILTKNGAPMPNAGGYFDGDTPGYGWLGDPNASPSTNTATVTNLCTNPGGEIDATGWSPNETGVTVISSTEQVFRGSRAIKITCDGVYNQGGAVLSIPGTFKSGVPYTVSARVRKNSTNAAYYLTAEFGQSPNIGAGNTPATQDTWMPVSATFTPTADRTNVTLHIHFNGWAAGTIWVDDICVVAGTSNTGYFDGDMPGAVWTGTPHASTSTRVVTGTANLCANPSAAYDAGGWSSGGAYITPGGSVDRSDYLYGLYGNYCIRIIANGQYQGGEYTAPGPFYAGVAYTLSLWTHGNSGGEPFLLQFGATDGSGFASLNIDLMADPAGWQRWSLTWTPNNTVPWSFFNLISRAGGPVVWVDGITIVQGDQPAPFFFDGDSPGCWWMGARGNSASVMPPLVRTTDWSSDGGYSALWSARPRTDEAIRRLDTPTFLPLGGASYGVRLSYKAYTVSGGNVEVYLQWDDGTTEPLATITGTGEGSVVTRITVPLGIESATIRAEPTAAGTYDVAFDDVFVGDADTTGIEIVLSETGERLLTYMPPIFQGSFDIRAVVDVCGREIERFETEIANVRANLFPQEGEDYLFLWELLLSLAANPPDKSVEQRRNSILSFLRAMSTTGTGLAWEEDLSRLIGTGWTYQEHDPNDPGSPPPYTIDLVIPYTSAIANPAQPTGTPGTSGSLATATYIYRVTAINTFGETLPSPQRSVAVTGPNGSVALSWTAIDGATGYRIYRATTSGVEHYLDQVATNSYTDDGSKTPDADRSFPNLNSTQSVQAYEAERLARAITPAHIDLVFGYSVGFIIGVSEVGEEPL